MTQIHTHEAGEHDSAYDGLSVDDAHWAFGAGQELGPGDDPLAGVDTTVPDGVDPADLAAYCLMLGDDALVLSHRLSEWCSRAPDLEEDIALANIALDLLGQARLLLARAAAADPGVVPVTTAPAEDALAFFRSSPQFRNVRLVELPNGDFGETVARLLLFSTYRLALFERLATSRDPVLAAIAGKGVKELTYHRDFAARWFVVLARGTDESRRRLLAGLDGLLPRWPELFATHAIEGRVASCGVGVDPAALTTDVEEVLGQVLDAAELPAVVVTASDLNRSPERCPERCPERSGQRRGCGRDGDHTDALGRLLAEMQVVARAHPQGRW